MRLSQRWIRATFTLAQRRLHVLQNRLGILLGCPPDRRAERVSEVLRRDPAEATGYWLQLVVATGIATLGLVLDSTAVVIGAMLIAPLMTPIVGLGMGLAVGSPFLVLRSSIRILFSIVCVVLGSAALTRLLPFHELTPEIAARTAPTALDLLTAAFCALAGAYAAMRPGSSTATTAAGTSIGISLVPPLCASGYGTGVENWNVAGGAGLLFVANFSAIVVVGTLLFMLAGFHRVNVAELEGMELERGEGARFSRAVTLALSRVFTSSGGLVMRLLMPLVLVLVVYAPLRTALDEVAWQIRVRSRVELALGAISSRVVEQRLRAERGRVELVVILLGTTDDAEAVTRQLRTALDGETDEAPHLEIVAIPDAAALSGLASSLRSDRPVQPIEAPRPPGEEALRGQAVVHDALRRAWPESSLGAVLRVWTEATGPADALHVHVIRTGEPMGDAARTLLSRALSERLDTPVTLEEHVLPRALDAQAGPSDFLLGLGRMLGSVELLPATRICVSVPSAPRGATAVAKREREDMRAMLDRIATGSDQITVFEGAALHAELVSGPCPAAPSPPAAPPP